jgi:hypothetical protein
MNKILCGVILFLSLFGFSTFTVSANDEPEEKQENFNAGELIIGILRQPRLAPVWTRVYSASGNYLPAGDRTACVFFIAL